MAGSVHAVLRLFFLRVAATERMKKRWGWRVEGDTVVETDKNSCDRNEECSVLKGLAFTPEVCFHSLIRAQRSRCSSKQASRNCFTPLDGSLVETSRGASAAAVCRPAGGHMIRRPKLTYHLFMFTSL